MTRTTHLLTTFSSSFLLVLACSGRDVRGTGQGLVGVGDGGTTAAIPTSGAGPAMNTGTTDGNVTNPGTGLSTGTATVPGTGVTTGTMTDPAGEGGTSTGPGVVGVAGTPGDGVAANGQCGDLIQNRSPIVKSTDESTRFKAFGGAPGVTASAVYVDEACDDGNNVSGDGCDETCQLEPGWACSPDGACHVAGCGDSVVDSYTLSVDPTVPKIAFRPDPSGMAGTSAGPSAIYVEETCDDGNTASGDGCDSSCYLEVGWTCPEAGEACHEPSCGDGVREDYVAEGDPAAADAAFAPPAEGGAGSVPSSSTSGTAALAGPHWVSEACDDGNHKPGDGCDTACGVEEGYNCPPAGGACDTPKCGDGFIDGHYDGLVPATEYPGGFTSETGSGGWISVGGAGSTHAWIGEACDDGNLESGDGCSETCELEVAL